MVLGRLRFLLVVGWQRRRPPVQGLTRTFSGGQAFVPKGRRSVARGASPWTTASSNNKAPEGRQTAASLGGRRPPIRQTRAMGLSQPRLAPTTGVLSPRWGSPARSFAFQGLAPLATNLGSSGAPTRYAHSHPNTYAHSHTNTYDSSASKHLNLPDGFVARRPTPVFPARRDRADFEDRQAGALRLRRTTP